MKNSKNKKHIILGILFILVSVLVVHLVYTVIDQKDPSRFRTRQDYILDVETRGKKWLNGHFGVFFRFKFLGNVHWLVVPLLIWFLYTKRIKKERWQLAVLFSWFALVLFIAVKGYANARYQLTFVPMNTILLFYLLWKFLEGKTQWLKVSALCGVVLLSTFNIYHYFDVFQNYWNMRVSVSNPHFPYKITEYLRKVPGLGRKKKVYAVNQPIYFYYVPRLGVDYMDPYMVEQQVLLFRKTEGTRQKAFHRFKKLYKVKFILLKSIQKRFFRNKVLEEFLECECKLVKEDNGWLLYRLRNHLLENTVKQPGYQELAQWNSNGNTVKTMAPKMIRLHRRGIYRLDVRKEGNTNVLRVRNTASKKRIKKRLQIGYEFKAHSLGKDIPAGKYVHFIVRTSLPPRLVNINNCIIVADRVGKKKWAQAKTVFTTHKRRTYIVSKRIRENADRVIAYVRFSPKSTKDIMKISDMKVVVSDNPL